MTKNFKQIKSTIIGFLIWIGTGFYFVYPYFHKGLWEPHEYAVGVGVICGLALMLAPDRFVDWMFKWLDKKK